MEFRKVIYIKKSEEKFCDKYLKNEPKNEDECLPEGCQYVNTAVFDDGHEMDIKLCGVRYEEGSVNTAWTEAVLFFDRREVACSEVCEEYTGTWELEHNGNKYIVEVKAV